MMFTANSTLTALVEKSMVVDMYPTVFCNPTAELIAECDRTCDRKADRENVIEYEFYKNVEKPAWGSDTIKIYKTPVDMTGMYEV